MKTSRNSHEALLFFSKRLLLMQSFMPAATHIVSDSYQKIIFSCLAVDNHQQQPHCLQNPTKQSAQQDIRNWHRASPCTSTRRSIRPLDRARAESRSARQAHVLIFHFIRVGKMSRSSNHRTMPRTWAVPRMRTILSMSIAHQALRRLLKEAVHRTILMLQVEVHMLIFLSHCLIIQSSTNCNLLHLDYLQSRLRRLRSCILFHRHIHSTCLQRVL